MIFPLLLLLLQLLLICTDSYTSNTLWSSLSSTSTLRNGAYAEKQSPENILISPNSKRETCGVCKRIPRLCVCKVCRSKLQEKADTGGEKLHTDTFVTIIQDNFEHQRKLGSAVIVEQCLHNCNIVWHYCDGENATKVPKIQAQSDRHQLAVLYPSSDAISLSDLRNEQQQHPHLHLIVLDSTWYRAKKMYSRIPWLKDVPTVKLSENVKDRKPSSYQFRKQPDEYSLSTAECIGEAISEIEGISEVIYSLKLFHITVLSNFSN